MPVRLPSGFYWEQIADFIGQQWKDVQYSPTIREIADHFDKSEPWVYREVRKMVTAGYLESTDGAFRSLRVIRRPVSSQSIARDSVVFIRLVGGKEVAWPVSISLTHTKIPLDDMRLGEIVEPVPPVIINERMSSGSWVLIRRVSVLDPGQMRATETGKDSGVHLSLVGSEGAMMKGSERIGRVIALLVRETK